MKKKLTLLLILFFALELLAQSPVISNKNFSFGTYGRVGIGYGLGTEAAFPVMFPIDQLVELQPHYQNYLQRQKT